MLLSIIISLMGALTVLPVPPDSVVSVELILQTRGVHKSVLITSKQVEADVNGKHWKSTTQQKQWQAILRTLKGMNMARLSSLPADVSRSSVDAALQAHVRITTKTQTYESAPYDHPNPPRVLAPLVKMIQTCTPAASRAAFR